jgi:hypothetical protein
MKKSKKQLAIITALFVFIIFLSQCINTPAKPDPRGTAFAPEQTCRQCHQAIYDSAILTAHFNASAAATTKNVLGNFIKGHNSFVYDSTTTLQIEERDSGLYQALYINGIEKEARRFDILFGLKHAQTSLYWMDNHVYELPLSYYTVVNRWATSPGFSAAKPNFKRLIGKDCFECHSSNISNKKSIGPARGDYFSPATETELLEKNSLVYGIDCQRCHGPAANHVKYQIQHPEIKTAKYMVLNSSLSQQQRLDNCAVCHSGNDKIKFRARFEFRPGDLLADFFMTSSLQESTRDFDVHGNQLNLLKQSKCFIKTNKMNCSTCHAVHNNAIESLAVYSQKCMGCHTEAGKNFCTVAVEPGMVLQNNCIDCHMPKQSSSAISFQLSGSKITSSYLLRSHRIAIYNGETKKKHVQ